MMLKSILYSRTSPKMLLLAMVSAAYPVTSLAVTAGKVEFSIGNVAAVGPDGRSRPLAKGAEISTGETIHTADGRIQVRFTDGGYISLSPNTEFRIDDYNYEGKTDGNEKSFFSLVKGGLRAITGAIGHVNKKSYLVNTPVATIGIRGTEFLARMDGKLLVKVGDGAVYLSNPAGDIVLYKGQSGEVGSPGEKPQHSDEQPQVNAAGPKGGTPGETQQEQQQRQQNQFNYVAGQDVDASGQPCLVIGNCASLGNSTNTIQDNGIAYAWVDFYDGLWLGDTDVVYPESGEFYATTSELFLDAQGVKKLSSTFDYAGSSYTTVIEANPDVMRDSYGSSGPLSWSRWVGGSYTRTAIDTYYGSTSSTSETIQNAAQHFVWGAPTPSADMLALCNGNITATYSVAGYTIPTLTNLSTGTTSNVAGPVSGTLAVDFGNASLNINLTVGNVGTFSASGTHYASFGAPDFFFYSDTSGQFYGSGFFAGANASHAGVAYQYDDGNNSMLSGAVAFQRN